MNLSEDVRLISKDQLPIARAASAWLARLQARIGGLGEAWTARRQRVRDAEELMRFSDRELWDLGLGRSDLQAIASGTYHRD